MKIRDGRVELLHMAQCLPSASIPCEDERLNFENEGKNPDLLSKNGLVGAVMNYMHSPNCLSLINDHDTI
jgi:hypothetical protein